MANLNLLKSLIARHAAELPEAERPTFVDVAHSLIASASEQVSAYERKRQEPMFAVNEPARLYLAGQLRDEATAAMKSAVDRALKPVYERLARARDAASSIPAVDPAAAREVRDVLRSLPPAERNHAVRSSDDPVVASAVVNAPGSKFILDVGNGAVETLVQNYNRVHRPELVATISSSEALIDRVTMFQASVKNQLDGTLR